VPGGRAAGATEGLRNGAAPCTVHWLVGEGHFAVSDHAAEVYGSLRP
jgi:hypothetical protein